jgi:hypothetical protein
MLSVIKEFEKKINQGAVSSSEIGFIPLEDHGEGDRSFVRKNLHLRAIDKALGSEL